MRANAMIASSLSLVLAVMAVGGHASARREVSTLYNVNFVQKPVVQLNSNALIHYTYAATPGISGLSLLLLQTTASDDEQIVPSPANTATIVVVQEDICIVAGEAPCANGTQVAMRAEQVSISNSTTTEATFRALSGSPDDLKNFFFCFASKSNIDPKQDVCSFYSSFFDIDPENASLPFDQMKSSLSSQAGRTSTGSPTGKLFRRTPIDPTPGFMTITQSSISSILELVPASTVVMTPQATASSFVLTSFTTNSLPTSTTTTVTAPAAEPTVASSSSSSKAGLSIGAKVGIALGALAFALILLILALLFLRRKHVKRNQPEQVMLTHSMHQDSFSRNLITEKENHVSNSENATPIDEPTTLPIQRPYEPVPSAPYIGAAAAVPRRKPTAATMASTVSRGLSTTSDTTSSGLQSPRSGNGFEEYHDVPVYGDARHVPQVFPGNSSSLQAPFLHSEEGMTPEEVARLEEEERRIDAAIAEAERR